MESWTRLKLRKETEFADQHEEVQPPPSETSTSQSQTSTGLPDLKATAKDISTFKTFLVESFATIMSQPMLASMKFRELARGLLKANPSLSALLSDGDISLEADSIIDFGSLGPFLAQAEKDRKDTINELEAAGVGTNKRRRGRPFGSRNVSKDDSKTENVDEEANPEMEDEIPVPQKKSKRNSSKKVVQPAQKEPKSMGDDPQAGPGEPEKVDPFGEMEQGNQPNKSSSISLYTKCLIIEMAKKMKEEGNVLNIEKEVMNRFKKYFYSQEGERWKTGLLCKWLKNLFNGFQQNCFDWQQFALTIYRPPLQCIYII